MTINRDPYYDPVKDRHYVDKDPNNKWTYVADMSDECTKNNTTITSATAIVGDSRMTVLSGPTVQSGLYVKLQVQGPIPADGATYTDDAYVTIRCVCANGDQFDKTIWFKSHDD